MRFYIWRYVPNPFPTIYFDHPPYYLADRVIDDACSVVWCERQNEPGKFVLLLRATPELLNYFSDGNFLITRKETKRAMLVEGIELTTDTETGDYLCLTGRSAESILNQRIIWQTETKSGNADDVIYYFVKENASDYWYYHTDSNHVATDPARFRYINLLRIAEHESIGAETAVQPYGQNLGAFTSNVCKAFGLGYKIEFNDGYFDFSCYQGTDRSLNQSDVPAVVFSAEFENLGNTVYSRNRQTYYNRIIVAGEGEGKDRQEAVHSRAIVKNCGMLMREKFVDKHSVSSNSDGTSSGTSYYKLLNEIAVAEADASVEQVNFSGEVIPGGQFQYRRDYFLGDTVSVRNPYGITGTAVVTAVDETEDETGYKLVPTLSDWKG